MPLLGAHEHFNWGFSTTGIYCAIFQVSGQRTGESTNIASRESTFVFHVQPLPAPTNFLTWQKSHWPPGFNPPTTLTSGNPDGDPFDNLREYAFALSPTNASQLTAAPLFHFVTNNSQRFGALTFTRYLSALDLEYTPESASDLPGDWQRLTNLVSAVPNTNGLTELLTLRDHQAATNTQRFLRLHLHTR